MSKLFSPLFSHLSKKCDISFRCFTYDYTIGYMVLTYQWFFCVCLTLCALVVVIMLTACECVCECVSEKTIRVDRNKSPPSSQIQLSNLDSSCEIIFSSNEPLVLDCVQLVVSETNNLSHAKTSMLFGKVAYSTEVQLEFEETICTLSNPILIQKNHFYTIAIRACTNDEHQFESHEHEVGSCVLYKNIEITYHDETTFSPTWMLVFNELYMCVCLL